MYKPLKILYLKTFSFPVNGIFLLEKKNEFSCCFHSSKFFFFYFHLTKKCLWISFIFFAAVVDLNGRYFGGRVVKAGFYNLDKFRHYDLAEEQDFWKINSLEVFTIFVDKFRNHLKWILRKILRSDYHSDKADNSSDWRTSFSS